MFYVWLANLEYVSNFKVNIDYWYEDALFLSRDPLDDWWDKISDLEKRYKLEI